MKDEERHGRPARPSSSLLSFILHPSSFILFFASRRASFRCAFAGWAGVLRTQPNARLHAAATAAVAALAAWLGLGRLEWAVLALTVGLVWVAECANTAVEAAVDLASPGLHPLARAAKDAAAAAVLAAALAAVAVGLLLLGPPLWARLRG
jgi:diacylglycerol kinase